MDEDLVEVHRLLARLRGRYRIAEAYLFGSRARGDALRHSDLDLLLVSPDFQELFFTSRMAAVLREWTGPMDLEVLCYTPEEFERKKAQLGMVREAVTKGLRVA